MTVDSETATVLVFDLMDRDLGSFMKYVSSMSLYLSPQTIKPLVRKILQGVAHCHQNNIMHRDLKPQNVLLDDDMNLKLTDFGLGCPISGSQTLVSDFGPPIYRAPETLLGSTSYSSGIDIWAVGCIFAELVTGQAFFDGANEVEMLIDIFTARGTPTEQTWRGVSSLPEYNSHTFPHSPPMEFYRDLHRIGAAGLDLLDKMLAVSPSARITAVTALNHPYFSC